MASIVAPLPTRSRMIDATGLAVIAALFAQELTVTWHVGMALFFAIFPWRCCAMAAMAFEELAQNGLAD